MNRILRPQPVVWVLTLILAVSGSATLVAQGLKRPTPTPFPRAPQAQEQNLSNLPQHMKIRYEEDLVTGEIRNVPIQKVMDELAARTGVVFEVCAQNEALISVSLYRVSLGEAITRILGPGNSIFYFTKDEAGKSRLQLVRSLVRPNVTGQASLRYIGTGSITKTGDDTVESPEHAVKVLAESKNVELRQKAVEVLVASKGEGAVQALIAAMNDEAPEVRAGAIEGLASLSVRSALPEILKRLKDEHPGVRHSAVKAVALLGEPENLKQLRPLGKDKDATVAAAAEIAIQQLSMRRP
jgi:hypothetical protein